ncbi:MAG: formylglycine-generating enzyme family protein [Candidatus Hydrogenedentota bacterium]
MYEKKRKKAEQKLKSVSVEMKKKLEEYVEKPPTKGRRALFGPLKIGIGIMAFLALCALPLVLLFATTDINPPKPEGDETEGAKTTAVTWLEGAYAGDTVTVDLGDGVTMDMVWCEEGTFEMGDESGHPDEQPVHEVRITEGFWLGRYEVTQAQWKAVTGHNPAKFVQSDHPVESVSWIDCQTFLKKLEAEVGGEFRLPTEAEWEYACRAGSTSTYCFGNLAEELQEYAWYAENSDGHTHPVGTKAANAWRFHDMHGNVAEWCQDWYDREFYSQSPVENPCNTDTGNHRTMRGGSWLHIVGNCRSASRLNGRPPDASHNVGLRVVASLPSTTPIGDPNE